LKKETKSILNFRIFKINLLKNETSYENIFALSIYFSCRITITPVVPSVIEPKRRRY